MTVTLRPRDPAGLAAYASDVSDPGSPEYHHYLSVSQFAARFGPGVSAIRAVRASLRAHGLSLGALSANHLALLVDSDAAHAGHAFSTSFQQLSLADGRTAYANTAAPQVDSSVAPDIQAIIGLNTVAAPQPLALTRRVVDRGTLAPAVTEAASSDPEASPAAAPAPCPTATTAAEAKDHSGAYTINEIASAYGFDGLYSQGDEGAGETIGLYELEGNNRTDISAFQSCYDTDAQVSYQSVDGGGSGSSPRRQQGEETELDAENVIGLAPQANVVIYQGPDTDQGSLDTYEAIISQDTVNVISTSWGDCESDLGGSAAQSENTLFEEAAAQGQTVAAAAGDDGAQDCYDVNGSTGAAVDDPASQPLVTGVGGTSLTSASPVTETVWKDGSHGIGAGGGGDSTLWKMPIYQSAAAGSLNVISSQSSASTCAASGGEWCREVPDVSGDADPDTGYLIYWDGNGSATDRSAWIEIGGTSGAAPVWAALFALADATSACTGGGVGFANSALYSAAGSDYAAYFKDVTSGDNDWLGDNGGQFAAGVGYDQASGLGTPIASALAPALCGQRLTLANPGAQASAVGTVTTLQLRATDATPGAKVSYGAQNLPAGLSLDDATGLISGTPVTAGGSEVTVTASDGDGSSATQTFSWSVAAAPSSGALTSANGSAAASITSVASVSMTELTAQRGMLNHAVSLQLHAVTSGGAAIAYLAGGLPPGLRLDPSSGLVSGVPIRAGIYRPTVEATSPGATTAVERFTWTISGPPTISHASLRGITRHRASLSFQLAAGLEASPLKEISIALPRGLHFATRERSLKRQISVRGTRTPHGFAVSFVRGHLIITLRSDARAPKITISAPLLAATSRLIEQTRRRRVGRFSVAVRAVDSGGLATGLGVRLKPS